MAASLAQLTSLPPAALRELTDLLIAVVDDGASIGFLPPLARSEAEAYWQGVLGPGVVLLVAQSGSRILGTVQLQLAMRANGRHRAEVAKLMVHPDARRQGLGRRLMEAVEVAARREERTLLVLDTRAGDPSNGLYSSLGFVEAGRIPDYARSADGSLDATALYYKRLG